MSRSYCLSKYELRGGETCRRGCARIRIRITVHGLSQPSLSTRVRISPLSSVADPPSPSSPCITGPPDRRADGPSRYRWPGHPLTSFCHPLRVAGACWCLSCSRDVRPQHQQSPPRPPSRRRRPWSCYYASFTLAWAASYPNFREQTCETRSKRGPKEPRRRRVAAPGPLP